MTLRANPYPVPPAWAHEVATVGVTGTNGKTSTARFVSAALAGAGPTARVTTVDAAIRSPDRGESVDDPPEDHGALLEFLRHFHARGGRRAVLEATSASLGLGFARAWPFRVGVFTNLGHDHMKTHGSFEHYLASKAQLFVHLLAGGTAVLNAGDPRADLIAEVVPDGVEIAWFAGPDAAPTRAVDLRIVALEHDWAGLRVRWEGRDRAGGIPGAIQLRALPAIQAENAAAAVLAAVALGIEPASAAREIACCDPPIGRFEPVDGPAGPRVVIDYAHGPEALATTLASARALVGSGRVVVVIGAGGDADASKRAPLGRAAAAADRVVLTSDNPRSESPEAIAAQVRAGLPAGHDAVTELDRARAITLAIADASPGDVVVVAGKGHERVQVTSDGARPFSDRHVVEAALGRS